MDELIEIAPLPEGHPLFDEMANDNPEHLNPFDGEEGVEQVKVTKPVDMDLLAEEIKNVAGDRAQSVLSLPYGQTEPSQDHPAVLFVRGARQDDVSRVVDQHTVPDVQAISPKDSMARLQDGEALSYEELTSVVLRLTTKLEETQGQLEEVQNKLGEPENLTSKLDELSKKFEELEAKPARKTTARKTQAKKSDD